MSQKISGLKKVIKSNIFCAISSLWMSANFDVLSDRKCFLVAGQPLGDYSKDRTQNGISYLKKIEIKRIDQTADLPVIVLVAGNCVFCAGRLRFGEGLI